MSKKKSKKKINRIKGVVAILIVIGMVLYFLYNIYHLVKQPTNSFVIEQGKIYSEEEAEGYIIRNEVVVSGQNYKNGIVQIKTEGQRVAKGDSVFRYYSKNENEIKNLANRLAIVDDEIFDVVQAQMKELKRACLWERIL